MKEFTWQNFTRVHFGKNQIFKLNDELKYYNRILLVYGGKSIKVNGLYDEVISILNENNKTVIELSGVEPNPKITSVYQGISLVKEHQIDFILAIGGGSVIDCAKGIAVGAKYNGDVFDIISGKVKEYEGMDFGCVLTLAATGTEMNPRAVISDSDKKLKLGIGNWSNSATYPNFSILDPTYTMTVPRDQTMYGIIDTISHAMEQYFHNNDNAILTERFALAIIKTMVEIGPKLLSDLQNYELRETMMYSSMMAWNGMLRVGANGGDWASHRLEHALSAVYDIPHAAGLAIIIPEWMRYVIKTRTDKFQELGAYVFGLSGDNIVLETINAFEQFLLSLGAQVKFVDYGILEESINIAELVDKTLLGDVVTGNYVPLDKEAITTIFNSCIK